MDKIQEAAELFKTIIKLDTTTLERAYMFHFYDGLRERMQCVVACKINGIMYMRLNDMPSEDGKNFVRNLIKNGVLSGDDIIHGFYKKCVNVFIKVESLLNNSDDLIKYIMTNDELYLNEYKRMVLMLKEDVDKVVDNIIPYGRIMDSENAFVRRTQLLTEVRRERESECVKEDVAEKTDEERLRDLVMQIEAMGWHVTLSIKE